MKEKFYNVSGKAVDANGETHYVTVVGKLEKFVEHYVDETPVHNDSGSVYGVLLTNEKRKVRQMTLGYAICHPDDEFDEEFGIRLATKRIETSPVGTLISNNVTMLNDDQNEMLILTELCHIIKNIDKYISK